MNSWKYLKCTVSHGWLTQVLHIIWQNPQTLLTSWQPVKGSARSLGAGYHPNTRWLSTGVRETSYTLCWAHCTMKVSLLVGKLLRISRWWQQGIKAGMGPLRVESYATAQSAFPGSWPWHRAREGSASDPWCGLDPISTNTLIIAKPASHLCDGSRRIRSRSAQTENSDILLPGWFSSFYHKLEYTERYFFCPGLTSPPLHQPLKLAPRALWAGVFLKSHGEAPRHPDGGRAAFQRTEK